YITASSLVVHEEGARSPPGSARRRLERRSGSSKHRRRRTAGKIVPLSGYLVRFTWLIRAMRLIRGIPVPQINHEARINHDRRRDPPPDESGRGARESHENGEGEVTPVICPTRWMNRSPGCGAYALEPPGHRDGGE